MASARATWGVGPDGSGGGCPLHSPGAKPLCHHSLALESSQAGAEMGRVWTGWDVLPGAQNSLLRGGAWAALPQEDDADLGGLCTACLPLA